MHGNEWNSTISRTYYFWKNFIIACCLGLNRILIATCIQMSIVVQRVVRMSYRNVERLLQLQDRIKDTNAEAVDRGRKEQKH